MGNDGSSDSDDSANHTIRGQHDRRDKWRNSRSALDTGRGVRFCVQQYGVDKRSLEYRAQESARFIAFVSRPQT